MTTYSQRDPRWKDIKLGFGQTTIGGYGCFLTCLSMLVGKTPDVVNQMLKSGGAFHNDLIISDRAAVVLGLQYSGKEYDINKSPDWFPSIKEVDMSPAAGKQQHFVVRITDAGKKYILDPWDGQRKGLSFYPFVSYRLFKAGSTCTHCPEHCPSR